jgi:carbonic anhydrase
MSSDALNIAKYPDIPSCTRKCAYNFKYTESSLAATNNDIMITLKYDNSTVPPVLYNSQKYTVSSIFIACPSIHVFNGKKSDAEIVIEHIPVKGGPNLSVAIPIVSSSESSTASSLLTQIIDGVSTNAPRQGESTNINISDFTLQDIVPNKPFFSYTDLQNNDWVVYGIFDAIPLSAATIQKMSQIIKPFEIVTQSKDGLYFNSTGPNLSSVGEGIYISCKPTGNSNEEVAVVKTKNETTYNWSVDLKNPTTLVVFQVFVIFLIIIAVFFFIRFAYSFISGRGVGLSSGTNSLGLGKGSQLSSVKKIFNI